MHGTGFSFLWMQLSIEKFLFLKSVIQGGFEPTTLSKGTAYFDQNINQILLKAAFIC